MLSAGSGTAPAVLNAISWGGCQLAPGSGGTPGTSIVRWSNATVDAGATQGIPLLLYAESGASLIVSPASHFFTAVHSTMSSGNRSTDLPCLARSTSMFGPHRPLHLKAGPGGGLLYWQPRAGVFPSGLSGWLDLPLSLYAPAYSLESVYINESAALPRYLKQFMVPFLSNR